MNRICPQCTDGILYVSNRNRDKAGVAVKCTDCDHLEAKYDTKYE